MSAFLLRQHPLNRHLRLHRWLRLFGQRPSLFFFYPTHQLPSAVLHHLFSRYGAAGFRWTLLGRSSLRPLWPKGHPAFHFLRAGNFYCLQWVHWEQWADARQNQPALASASFGLWEGHFFFDLNVPQQKPLMLSALLSANWSPLVDALCLLAAQLTLLLSPSNLS